MLCNLVAAIGLLTIGDNMLRAPRFRGLSATLSVPPAIPGAFSLIPNGAVGFARGWPCRVAECNEKTATEWKFRNPETESKAHSPQPPAYRVAHSASPPANKAHPPRPPAYRAAHAASPPSYDPTHPAPLQHLQRIESSLQHTE